MKFCSKCNQDYGNWYNFCPECGLWLKKQKAIRCPDCREIVYGIYCVNCGEWVGEELLKELRYKVDRRVAKI
jgi:predicted amidophosphoribosyltransferase